MRPILHSVLPAALLLALTAAAQPMKPSTPPAPGAAKPSPARPSGTGTNVTVITVGTTAIKSGRIDTLAALMARARGADLRDLAPEQIAALRRAVASTLIGQELVELEAKAKGVQAPASRVDSALNSLKAQFPDPAAWREAMRRSGDTEAQVRARIARQIRADRVLESNVTPPMPPDEAELRAFWEKHKAQFPVSDSLRAVQILMLTDGKASPEVVASKKRRLEAIRKELAEDSSDTPLLLRRFMGEAARAGEGPEARNGGDLERFHPGDFHPDFKREVAKLGVGEMSTVFRTPLGLHLVLLIEKYDGRFESYRLQCLQNIMVQKNAQTAEDMRKFLKRLGGKYPVKYLRAEYRDLSESGIY